jgi:hypothetical protein
MTCYHGRENGSLIFSGFDLWTFRRAQSAQLVDAVLQGMWHLHRQGVRRPVTEQDQVATDPPVRLRR